MSPLSSVQRQPRTDGNLTQGYHLRGDARRRKAFGGRRRSTFTASTEPWISTFDLRLVRETPIVGDRLVSLNVAAIAGIEDLPTGRCVDHRRSANRRRVLPHHRGGDAGSLPLSWLDRAHPCTGPAETVVAGVFNAACLHGGLLMPEELVSANAKSPKNLTTATTAGCDDAGSAPSETGRSSRRTLKTPSAV